jgi:DNA-binding PadR family transcriptional regulator
MNTGQDIRSHLPLTEATLFILFSLAPGPRHGYAIMKDVQSLSHGRVVLSTGTLYGALKRLLQQDWIERVNEDESSPKAEEETGRPRKRYVLTHQGRRALDAEVERLRGLLAIARLRTERARA